MNKKRVLAIIALLFVALRIFYHTMPANNFEETKDIGEELVELPEPALDSETSVEEALESRRSLRSFSNEELSLNSVSQMSWAAQGITDELGRRSSPSAGETYPLELYLSVGPGSTQNLSEGTYRYLPEEHSLNRTSRENIHEELVEAAYGQGFIEEAPVVFVLAADYERTTGVYGDRGERYVKMEAGHAAQNMYLQAETLDLGTVVVGAFEDDEVKNILDTDNDPLYIIPVGKPE